MLRLNAYRNKQALQKECPSPNGNEKYECKQYAPESNLSIHLCAQKSETEIVSSIPRGEENLVKQDLVKEQLQTTTDANEPEVGPEIARGLNDIEVAILAGSLNPKSFIDIQVEVNKLACNFTSAETAFLLFPTRDEDMLYLRVMGDRDVGPITFTIAGSLFKRMFEEKSREPIKYVCNAHRGLFQRLATVNIRSFLCVPYFYPANEDIVTFLACVLNKKDPNDQINKISLDNTQCPPRYINDFSKADANMLKRLFKSFGPVVMTSVALHKDKVRKQKKCKIIELSEARVHLEELSQYINMMMIKAKYILCSENCSFFLVDNENSELVAKIMDGISLKTPLKDIRFSLDYGIYGQVARAGLTIILNRSFNMQLSDRKSNNVTTVPIKNMICFPIKNKGEVFAVAEFSNKIGNHCFNSDDKELCFILGEIIKNVAHKSLCDYLKS